jgi:transcriptional regulator with XRE-family HTH domain
MKTNETNINEIIAKNLKIARNIKGLTLKDVGAILGITGQQAQKYECGKNPIAIDKLMQLSKHYNFPITFFLKEFQLPEDN